METQSEHENKRAPLKDAINMTDEKETQTLTLTDVTTALKTIEKHFPISYIVVGGASLLQQGSSRLTKDIDLLIDDTAALALYEKLPQQHFIIHSRSIFVNTDMRIPVDILTRLLGTLGYQELFPFTRINAGLRMLDHAVSLGVKIRTYYMRDDSDDKKKASDIADILFITQKMEKEGLTVTDEAADIVRVHWYNFELVLIELRRLGHGHLETFMKVGAEKFRIEWDDNSQDQKELYNLLMEDCEDDV